MKKLIILSLLLSVQSCFLVPSNCTVNLSCNGQTFSFDCMREDVNEAIKTMGLNHINIKESDNVYIVKNCRVEAVYIENVEIYAEMYESPKAVWDKTNPLVLRCSKIKWKKFKKQTGFNGILDSANVRMEIL